MLLLLGVGAVSVHEQEFKATFRQPHIPLQPLQALLDAPSPVFDLLEVEDVLPDEILGRYQQGADAAGA